MFNKKLFVILVFLLFVFQISFVSAQSDNQTEIINKSAESLEVCELNNHSSQKIETNNYSGKMEYHQGIIPIKINSPTEVRFLDVWIDGEEYWYKEFEKNDIIFIPTYSYVYFENNDEIDIVGLHNISLIFEFDDYISKDVDIFLDENSTLNFKFNENYIVGSNITTYTYNSTLNILKKDKTIHILNFTYYNLLEDAKLSIHKDNLEKYNMTYFNHWDIGYGICITKNNKLIWKSWYFWPFDIEEVSWDLYDNIWDIGVYNFTVVNFIDGTMDSVLFEAKKYQPKFNITHIVDGNSIKINFTLPDSVPSRFWAQGYIGVDNITEYFLIGEGHGDVVHLSFENLSTGVHTLNIECYGDRSEGFFYSWSFVIVDGFDLVDDNIIDLNSTYQNCSEDNLSFIGNTTLGNTTNPGGVINKHNGTGDSRSLKNDEDFKDIMFSSLIGENNVVESSSDLAAKKSYEVVEKSTIKSINNLTHHFQLIIMVMFLLLVGYFRFRVKKRD